ncbi:hypothetical protein T484DRAFT_3470998 [Baffinella frigidus]|nr:hypothetical protein T484DRAFT_3470998 [Cryptophyta sp. CCMP2293]
MREVPLYPCTPTPPRRLPGIPFNSRPPVQGIHASTTEGTVAGWRAPIGPWQPATPPVTPTGLRASSLIRRRTPCGSLRGRGGRSSHGGWQPMAPTSAEAGLSPDSPPTGSRAVIDP